MPLSNFKTKEDATQDLRNIDKRSNDDQAVLNIKIDHKVTMALGLDVAQINQTISTAWSGSYINDFIDRGRIKRVYLQGDMQYRSKPEDLSYWFVKMRKDK